MTARALAALLLALAGVPARAQPAPPPAAVPRLTAIVIGAGVRAALFAEQEGDTARVVQVGQQVGAFTVVAIRPGEAELAGPEGRTVVQPSPSLALPTMGTAPVTPLSAPAYREAVSETDQ